MTLFELQNLMNDVDMRIYGKDVHFQRYELCTPIKYLDYEVKEITIRWEEGEVWVEIEEITTETSRALEELKNALYGHCRSSYLKNNPEELRKVIDIYEGYFNVVETALKKARKL